MKAKQTEFSFPADVRYIHDRPTDIYYNYLPKGGRTFAYFIDHNDQKVFYAIAHCNDEDLYCRKIGRELALKRLTNLIENQVAVLENGMVVADTICVEKLKAIIIDEVVNSSKNYTAYMCSKNFREEFADKIAESIKVTMSSDFAGAISISTPVIISAIKAHADGELETVSL